MSDVDGKAADGTLFDLMPEGARLHVYHDGEVVPWGVDELFGTGEYTGLKAVSYVTSPSFLSRVIRGFDNVEVVLGLVRRTPIKRRGASSTASAIGGERIEENVV